MNVSEREQWLRHHHLALGDSAPVGWQRPDDDDESKGVTNEDSSA
jgi:hypothetical protein